jgi:ribosomal protein L7/L12
MAELKQMAEAIANLTIKEAIELANILKDEYELSRSRCCCRCRSRCCCRPRRSEQTQFDVILTSAGRLNCKLSK